MPYALTIDQVGSRQHRDLVRVALDDLSTTPTLLPFVRTVGDEFQGLLDDPLSVVDVILGLMRSTTASGGSGQRHRARWHIGLGIGPVESPLAPDSRSARGPAFLAARAAVERAKTSAQGVCVSAPASADTEAADAEVVFHLLAAIRGRRSAAGWEAVDLAAQGQPQSEIAKRIGVSRQAVSQRLAAAGWALEQDARPALARLLARAEALAGT